MSEQALAVLEDIDDAEIIDAPAVQRPASLLVRPVAPSAAIIANMREYEAVKRAILTDADYQQTRDGRFMKKSGYVKLSTAFGFSAEKVSERLDQDSDGRLIGAAITVRATAPNGRYAEGDGYCSIDEPRFTHQYDNKQKGIKAGDPILTARQKLRHDLPATAFTRAYNRACSFLFPGGGEVSWEEVDAGGEYHSLRSGEDEPDGRTAASVGTTAPKASPNKPASANQLATIAKFSRLLGLTEEPSADMTSAEASERITELSREYNEKKGTARQTESPRQRQTPPGAEIYETGTPETDNGPSKDDLIDRLLGLVAEVNEGGWTRQSAEKLSHEDLIENLNRLQQDADAKRRMAGSR